MSEALAIPTPLPIPIRRAAWAVRAAFFLSGALFATWGVQVPALKSHYALGEQALAVALLAAGAGAILALSLAGRLVPRWGARTLVAVTGLVCAGALAGMLWPRSYAVLLLLMALFGVAASLFDVAINTEANALEQRSGRTLMSGFHAYFSLGGMAAAAAGSAALKADWSPQLHLGVAASLAVGMVAVSAAGMLPLEPADPVQGADAAPHFSLPRGPLLLLGLLAALGLEAEGALYDWSVLFLVQERAADPALAALAYAAFTGAMALGRFGGDAVRARVPACPLLQGCGLLAAAGMTLALLWPNPLVALAGFAVVGLGLANVVPVLFSASARLPGIGAAQGIAAVSAMGYAGLMVGPPLIGFIAERSSLALGLSTVVAFALVLAAAARPALAAGSSRDGVA